MESYTACVAVLVAATISTGNAQENSLFQCQPSSQGNGEVFTPNIPDFYFNHNNTADYSIGRNRNLTRTGGVRATYIFTVPTSSVADLNCSGTIVSIQYCYDARNQPQLGNTVNVFDLVTLNQSGNTFTIAGSFSVQTTLQSNICSPRTSSGRWACCDKFDISPSNQIQLISSSNLTYGIVNRNSNVRPLVFRNAVEYRVEQFSATPSNSNLNLGRSFNGQRQTDLLLVLLRFIIVPVNRNESPTTEKVTTLDMTTDGASEPSTNVSTHRDVTLSLIPTIASDITITVSSGITITAPTTSNPAASSQVTTTIVGGVVGGIIVTGVLLFAIIICLIVVVRRLNTVKYTMGTQDTGLPISNMAYEDLSTARSLQSTLSMIYEANEAKLDGGVNSGDIGNSALVDDPHLYSEVIKSKEPSPETEHAYAEMGARPNSNLYEEATTKSYEEPAYDSIQQPGVSSSSRQQHLGEDEEELYVMPAMDEEDLYSQLDLINIKSLSRESLRLGKQLGSGQFGVVYEGVWLSNSSGGVKVAVKTLKEGSEEEDRVKFLQEAAIMGQFKHFNVVTMYGVVTEGEPILIALELLPKGDLRQHLIHFRSAEEGTINVDDHTLLSYCRQVVSGMAYLSSKAFVHRDLAARNILVSDDDICKIADFGMSRDLMDESYYVSHGGQIPVKWTAPEALHYKKYSTASDVWSHGALMYEIWSVGHKPFESVTNNEALILIDTGFRLPPPPGCPRALYNIMIACWHPVTSERPSFPEISRQLSLPDPKLLKWSEEDKAVHPEAAKLGADLLSAQYLYKDLQAKYAQSSRTNVYE